MLTERINLFDRLFYHLQETNSRNDKEYIVETFIKYNPDFEDDLTYIFETLDGKHPIGWTFIPATNSKCIMTFDTIKEMIMFLENVESYRQEILKEMEYVIGEYGEFIAPIVNRTLKLGIGKSLLKKDDLTPMLAKKYEPDKHTFRNMNIFITEKLDGNRCIAHYDHDTERWCFTSRSGKPMEVSFDMTGLPIKYIYDGEILSVKQTEASILRNSNQEQDINSSLNLSMFNETSGLINRQGKKSGLIYNIFDIMNRVYLYDTRREILDDLVPKGKDVRILPVLSTNPDEIHTLLDKICDSGGEGIMINIAGRQYEHKRTDALLKYKKVQHMDMLVYDIFEGKGKYEGLCGGIRCEINCEDGTYINCDVGSGLSDAQRVEFARNPENIIGKIVEIAYHELSQNTKTGGTNNYSLRFPRLIKIRNDKSEISEF